MNYKTDDLLYGFMQSIATFNPIEKMLYLRKRNYVQERATIAKICNCSLRTIGNHLNRLIENELICETETESNGCKIPCYVFPYNEDNLYQIVNKGILWYIISTRNKQAVRVYVYLLNKYKWKKDYKFTSKELQIALGYSENSRSLGSMFANILESFAREGVIRYEQIHETIIDGYGRSIPIPIKVLKFVAEKKENLPPLNAS